MNQEVAPTPQAEQAPIMAAPQESSSKKIDWGKEVSEVRESVRTTTQNARESYGRFKEGRVYAKSEDVIGNTRHRIDEFFSDPEILVGAIGEVVMHGAAMYFGFH